MRIAQLAPTYERVPPAAYGGTEAVVHLLSEELVRRGHEVTLFASGDSLTSARLVSVTDRPHRYGDPGGIRHAEYVHLANAQACFRAAARGEFDIVHNHAGIEGVVLAAESQVPVLTTSHGTWEPHAAAVWEAYPWTHHELTRAHAATHPERGQLAPVHHGLELHRFPPRLHRAGEGDLLFLGRFAPVKGPDTAIRAARLAGRRLLLAGKVDGSDLAWFEEHVMPHVDGDRVRIVGEVDETAKARLLADAAALLFPIAWEEPFGLVIAEALAAGTPVIGFRRGSVPELVEHGVTGFVVDDVASMAAAIERVGSIDRAACRREAEQRFTLDRMVDEVLERYEETISRGPDPSTDGVGLLAGV